MCVIDQLMNLSVLAFRRSSFKLNPWHFERKGRLNMSRNINSEFCHNRDHLAAFSSVLHVCTLTVIISTLTFAMYLDQHDKNIYCRSQMSSIMAVRPHNICATSNILSTDHLMILTGWLFWSRWAPGSAIRRYLVLKHTYSWLELYKAHSLLAKYTFESRNIPSYRWYNFSNDFIPCFICLVSIFSIPVARATRANQ